MIDCGFMTNCFLMGSFPGSAIKSIGKHAIAFLDFIKTRQRTQSRAYQGTTTGGSQRDRTIGNKRLGISPAPDQNNVRRGSGIDALQDRGKWPAKPKKAVQFTIGYQASIVEIDESGSARGREIPAAVGNIRRHIKLVARETISRVVIGHHVVKHIIHLGLLAGGQIVVTVAVSVFEKSGPGSSRKDPAGCR